MTYVKRTSAVCAVLFVLLLLYSQNPFVGTVRASDIFADDFNDGNYDGWYTQGSLYNYSDATWYENMGNLTAANNVLEASGDPGNASKGQYQRAYINSSVAYGTWSFDLYVVDNGHDIWFNLLLDNTGLPEVVTQCYFFTVDTSPGECEFGWWTGTSYYYLVSHDVGLAPWTDSWTHFDITRNSTGRFDVYLNGTHVMSATHTAYTEGSYFRWTGQTGSAIDNVVILDYVVQPQPATTTTTTTTTDTPVPVPDLTLPLVGASIVELGVIIVLVVLYVRRKP